MVIRTKIITIIGLTILLTIGTATVLLIRAQKSMMVGDKFADTLLLCDLIEKTTENAMKEGNTAEVQRIIENIGKSREIPHLRILSPDGTIMKSANRAEVGARSADFIKSYSKENFLRPVLTNDTTINYFHNISNRMECFGCHDKNNPVIGIIQMQYDISRNFATFLSIKKLLIFSNIGIVILISVILSTLFSSLVMKPLKDLLSAIHDVERGNWQASAKVSGNDELGIIVKSFNSMVQEINNLYQKNILRERELSRIKGDLERKNNLEDLNTQLEFKVRELETANKAITSLSNEVKSINIKLEKAVKSSYFSTIQSLISALESNDRFARGHSERVRLLSVELGRYIGLDVRELEILEHASILHDIGKIGIEKSILMKSGKLSSVEYGIIKTHPLIGDEMLGPIGTMEEVRKTIIQHHERYDGNGYPFGLSGNEISLKSRILAVADTFDAMMTDRAYRKALPLYEVKTELKSNAGTQFDPYVAGAFVDLLNSEEGMLISRTGYTDFSPL
jgi:HD-GYP domain-containing protein (c-di-GMP phosphodiesterase class II)